MLVPREAFDDALEAIMMMLGKRNSLLSQSARL